MNSRRWHRLQQIVAVLPIKKHTFLLVIVGLISNILNTLNWKRSNNWSPTKKSAKRTNTFKEQYNYFYSNMLKLSSTHLLSEATTCGNEIRQHRKTNRASACCSLVCAAVSIMRHLGPIPELRPGVKDVHFFYWKHYSNPAILTNTENI